MDAHEIADGPEVLQAEPVEAEPVEAEEVEAEEVDAELVAEVSALPIVADLHELAAPPRFSARPAVQAAAAAATGFMAGAATLALVRRYGLRKVAGQMPGMRDVLDGAPVRRPGPFPFQAANTYLVHVRVYNPPPPPRPRDFE